MFGLPQRDSGTLTCNQLQVRNVRPVSDQYSEVDVLRFAAICSAEENLDAIDSATLVAFRDRLSSSVSGRRSSAQGQPSSPKSVSEKDRSPRLNTTYYDCREFVPFDARTRRTEVLHTTPEFAALVFFCSFFLSFKHVCVCVCVCVFF